MKQFTILVDMDDTIENLLEVWVRKLNLKHNMQVNYSDITDWDMSLAFPNLTMKQIFEPLYDDNIWDEVEPLPDSEYYLEKLFNKGHNIYIVTNSHYATIKAKMEKVLKKYFPFITWQNVIITSKKQMIKGDILIDDAVHNLKNGDYIKILMDAPHNQSYDELQDGSMIRVYSWREIYEVINRLAKED